MSKLEAAFERVKYDARQMLGLYEAPAGPLGEKLAAARAQYGENLLRDLPMLQQALAEAGAAPVEICQVCLMTQVSGFEAVVRQDPRTIQADLDRYIQNAAGETGFNRDTVLRLTGSIVFALGGQAACPAPSAPAAGADSGGSEGGEDAPFSPQTVAVMAQALYEQRLQAFQADLEQAAAGGHVTLDFTRLEPLVNVGIPRAQYCMGVCLLKGIQLPANEQRGLELLRQAADMGDSAAAAALGDYCCAQGGSDSLTRAYQYYTGCGAAALDQTRQTAVAGILNQKIFNGRLLRLCVLLLAVCAATVIFPPAAALYAPCTGLGWAALAVQAALLALGVLRFRVRPYDGVYTLPVAMCGVWFLYMLARFFL